jgi:hypothetical protein
MDDWSYMTTTPMDNPFSDSKAGSRVTASGFTESTYKGDYSSKRVEKEELLRMKERTEQQLKMIKEMEIPRLRKDSGYHDMMTEIRDHTVELGEKSVKKLNSILTLDPDDSVSVAAPKPLKRRTIKEDQEVQTEFTTSQTYGIGSMYDDVIGGYGMTASEKLEELNEMVEIQKVTGLAKPFFNERLNFLMHLHKQLYRIMKHDGQYPANDSLYQLTRFLKDKKGSDRTPHEDLLYQVIHSTISVSRMKVKSNPFNIPILEVGMTLTDKIVNMTFTELHNEYQTVWFNTMKDLEVPGFHDKYSKLGALVRRVTTSKRKTGSVLGF